MPVIFIKMPYTKRMEVKITRLPPVKSSNVTVANVTITRPQAQPATSCSLLKASIKRFKHTEPTSQPKKIAVVVIGRFFSVRPGKLGSAAILRSRNTGSTCHGAKKHEKQIPCPNTLRRVCPSTGRHCAHALKRARWEGCFWWPCNLGIGGHWFWCTNKNLTIFLSRAKTKDRTADMAAVWWATGSPAPRPLFIIEPAGSGESEEMESMWMAKTHLKRLSQGLPRDEAQGNTHTPQQTPLRWSQIPRDRQSRKIHLLWVRHTVTVRQSHVQTSINISSFTKASGMCSPRGRAWKATPEMCHILKNCGFSWLKMTEWEEEQRSTSKWSSKFDRTLDVIFSSTHSGATSSWRLFRQLWDSENLFSPVSPVPSMAFTSVVTDPDVKHPICHRLASIRSSPFMWSMSSLDHWSSGGTTAQ